MVNEKVKELAETLKKQGLAASMHEAMEKAQRIIGDEENEQEETQENGQQIEQQEKEGAFGDKEKIHPEEGKRFEQPNYNISKETSTVNELMKELGVNPEKIKELEKEKIGEQAETLKKEIEEVEGGEVKKEKVKEFKEKVGELKEEADELEEEQ